MKIFQLYFQNCYKHFLCHLPVTYYVYKRGLAELVRMQICSCLMAICKMSYSEDEIINHENALVYYFVFVGHK